MVEERAHSELGASSYSRWRECPGSIRLSRGIEKKSSIYAEEGTRAHALAEKILRLKLDEKMSLEEFETDEMLEAVQVYVEHVRELQGFLPRFEAVEQRFDLSAYYPDLFGTCDYVCYFEETKTLHIVDYKHGAGVAVEVEENEQLMYYGIGALHKNKMPIEKIVLTIVQPRCYHPDGPIRSWETDPMRMLDFVADLIDDAKATAKEDAPIKPGEHCRWCPAQAICPSLKNRALVAAQEAFAPDAAYSPEKLAEALSLAPQVEAWAKAVREFAYREAESGRVPPGWKLVDKRVSRKWGPDANEEELVLAMAKDFSLDPGKFFVSKLLSPPQVEKLLNKDQKKRLKYYTLKESSGKNLVPVSDDREAVNTIETAFAIIES